MEYQIEEIESIEKLEDFSDEYVYDIEVDDTHMFFANDILVHNSIYVEFGRISNQLKIPKEKEVQFIVDLWNYGCAPYINECYEKYAKEYNCDKNLQVLELEKIARTSIMLAKKHYFMEECWGEPGIFFKPLEATIYKGLEVIQGSTPPFARECQKDFYETIAKWYIDHSEYPPFNMLYNKIKKYKQDFVMQDPDSISKGSSISDYDKFILDDKNSLVIGEHCPIHVKGAGIANYFLNRPENARFKNRYNFIKTRDKVKFYYSSNPTYNVFAFLPNAFPMEYAPPIDYNMQFEKVILEPLNRVIKIFNYNPLNPDLVYTTSLF